MKQVTLPALALIGAVHVPAMAASVYPNKPVRILVATLSGSTPDVVARVVAPGLSARLGQQFIIDNRGGANGLIGAELAAKATPDGYTLLVGTTATLTVMRHVQKGVPFDTLKDFAPIGLLAVRPYLLVVPTSSPVRSVNELVSLAKAQPGKLTYGSAGKGSSTHLAMELFNNVAGIDIGHVPYKGGPQATLALVSARVNVSVLSIRNALPHVHAQRLRALAITGSRRSPQLPQVPTASESGLKGFEAVTWFALLTPARTPQHIVVRLNDALQQVIGSTEVSAQFAREGVEPGDGGADVLQALIKREIKFYCKLTKISGIKVN